MPWEETMTAASPWMKVPPSERRGGGLDIHLLHPRPRAPAQETSTINISRMPEYITGKSTPTRAPETPRHGRSNSVDMGMVPRAGMRSPRPSLRSGGSSVAGKAMMRMDLRGEADSADENRLIKRSSRPLRRHRPRCAILTQASPEQLKVDSRTEDSRLWKGCRCSSSAKSFMSII